MQTEALFEDIADRLAIELNEAQESIYIAVAWFTNRDLYKILVKQAKRGLKVSLMLSNDHINHGSSLDFELLRAQKGKVFLVGDGDRDLMHHKFCVIDGSTVITGSYNWSFKAENNHENIVINKENEQLAEAYLNEFKNIRNAYFGAEPKLEQVLPLQDIVKRLEILKNYIGLKEIDEVERVGKKLKEFDFNEDISNIHRSLQNKEYATAVLKIQDFISLHQQLAVWTDPEISGLRLEIMNYENQLNAFDNERTELEKLITLFMHQHTLLLGDFISEILSLRRLIHAKDKTLYEDAEEDEKNYHDQMEKEQERVVKELTEEQKREIKNNFRKATFLCHPDKVGEEYQHLAAEVFNALKDAYDANDIDKVNDLLHQLEHGQAFRMKSQTVTENTKLKAAIEVLRRKIAEIETQIFNIKESDTYKTINKIENWDDYFEEQKRKLSLEYEELKKKWMSYEV